MWIPQWSLMGGQHASEHVARVGASTLGDEDGVDELSRTATGWETDGTRLSVCV